MIPSLVIWMCIVRLYQINIKEINSNQIPIIQKPFHWGNSVDWLLYDRDLHERVKASDTEVNEMFQNFDT